MAMFKIPKPVRPRGVRFSLPAGYVLGRVSPGYGDAELIPIDQLSQEQLKSGIIAPGPVVGGTTVEPPVVGAAIPSYAGLLKNHYMPLAMLHVDVMMPAATPNDLATCRIAPASDVVLTIVYDPATYEFDQASGYLGTITFLAGHTTGTVAWSSAPTLLVRGTTLYLYTSLANTNDPSPAVDTAFTTMEILLTTDLV